MPVQLVRDVPKAQRAAALSPTLQLLHAMLVLSLIPLLHG